MDMIDPLDYYNTFPAYKVNHGFGGNYDLFEGYNIVHIQNSIINTPTTWNEWKNNIKNNSNNGTE